LELVYLWVEDYKNIQKQGFNFSPRFECKFNDEYEKDEDGNDKLKPNCKLEIKPKEHIENFFGDNINVTAIVGKNGSGKSSIIKSILQIDNFDNNYIIVYRDNERNYYYSNITDIETEIIKNASQPFNRTIVYLNYQHEHYAFRNHNYRLVENSKQAVINVLVTNKIKNEIFKLSTFMYFPKTIEITYKEPKKLIDKFIEHIITGRDEFEIFFNSLRENNFYQFLLIKYLERGGADTNIYRDEEKLKNFFNDELNDLQDKYNLFINLIATKTFNFLGNDDELKVYAGKEYFDYFEFDLIDDKNRRYNHLSSGEQIMFAQLLQISFYLHADNNSLFIFDEPEVYLHPNWQKNYLNEVITLLQKFQRNNHFIFTSHSPFLLSDIPKQNIIFLDKDEKGNCKVVDGLKEKKQTFGANIHTLLSDSFFMDDGLRGEFAKNKIDEAIRLLNKDKLDEKDLKYCEQIISIIGEPIVKNQLEKMLHYKKVDYLAKDTREEIEFLKHRIDLLSKRL
jgi:predicted ATPase